MAKALVPTPNTGGQHWERFHVLGRVDCLVVQGLCWHSNTECIFKIVHAIRSVVEVSVKKGEGGKNRKKNIVENCRWRSLLIIICLSAEFVIIIFFFHIIIKILTSELSWTILPNTTNADMKQHLRCCPTNEFNWDVRVLCKNKRQ